MTDAYERACAITGEHSPLEGFESCGPFGRPGACGPLTCAYKEITEEIAATRGWSGQKPGAKRLC